MSLYNIYKTPIVENDLDYFIQNKDKIPPTQLSLSLDFSIQYAKLKFIYFFVENGVSILNNTCMDELAKKKNGLKCFQYLHSKGIEVATRGNFPLFYSAMSNQLKNYEFLEPFSEKHSIVFRHITSSLLFRSKKEVEKKPLQNFEDILRGVLYKINPDDFAKILIQEDHYNQSTKDIVAVNKTYLQKIYYETQIPVEEHNTITKKMKI